MPEQNYLGVYIGKDRATAVCLQANDGKRNVLGCFSLTHKHDGEHKAGSEIQELARLIAEGCSQREFKFNEVAVAMDSSMFMQHKLHSEFKETKKIAQTVRSDTEEALSADVTELAIVFNIASISETGSELTVYTAKKEILSAIVLAFQSNHMDPVTVEPDINCLSRFVSQNLIHAEDSSSLFAILSRQNGYLISFTKSEETSAVRTFLTGTSQDRTALLARQVPLTIASMKTDRPINCIRVFDSVGTIDCQRLHERLGIEVAEQNITSSVTGEAQMLSECADAVELAAAYGAALALTEKTHLVNFRNDYMPYQGRKRRVENMLKALSVSATILMIALGTFVTSQMIRNNKYRSQLRQKFEPQYSAIMRQKAVGGLKPGVKKLESAKRVIEAARKGLDSGDQAVPAKLKLVLEAFNKCASPVQLNVDTITITDKFITIKCDTSQNRGLQLQQALEQTGLSISHQTYGSDKQRDNLTLTIAPKKGG